MGEACNRVAKSTGLLRWGLSSGMRSSARSKGEGIGLSQMTNCEA
nr:MAG TPA: hypothetical protein [Caudoviricetes sp.]